MDANTFPNVVEQYLKCHQELTELKKIERGLKQRLTSLRAPVGDWLQRLPSSEIKLDGKWECGKLKISIEKRKEYLSQKTLYIYLRSFFQQISQDKTEAELHEITKAAVIHIWSSRKITKNSPIITRTFSNRH